MPLADGVEGSSRLWQPTRVDESALAVDGFHDARAHTDQGVVNLPLGHGQLARQQAQLQMSHAHQGNEHDGDVGVDAALGPVEYRTDAQIAPGTGDTRELSIGSGVEVQSPRPVRRQMQFAELFRKVCNFSMGGHMQICEIMECETDSLRISTNGKGFLLECVQR